jgi:DNA polymerase-1
MPHQDLQKLWPIEGEMSMSLYRMMKRGIKIDVPHTKKLHLQAEESMQSITEDIGFRPSERSKLEPFLLEELKLPVLKTGKSGPSFDKSVMEEYDLMLEMRGEDNQRAKQVMEFRGWQKADTSFYQPYINLLSPDGRIHPSLKLHGTITSRLACEKPNLQQIPRRTDKYGIARPWIEYLYDCFIAEPGFSLWVFDYKNLEFRIAAYYAEDQELIDRINAGEDVHQASRDMIASLTGMEFDRYPIKTTNFLKLYGGQRNRLALQLKVKEHKRDDRSCKCSSCVVNEAWEKTFWKMKAVMQEAQIRAQTNGYVKYWSGRKKHYGTIFNKKEEHKAFNALCQGGGAEVVKHSIVRCKDIEDENNARLVLTVHDSQVWEIRNGYEKPIIEAITNKMTDFHFPVNLEVDVHEWGKD